MAQTLQQNCITEKTSEHSLHDVFTEISLSGHDIVATGFRHQCRPQARVLNKGSTRLYYLGAAQSKRVTSPLKQTQVEPLHRPASSAEETTRRACTGVAKMPDKSEFLNMAGARTRTSQIPTLSLKPHRPQPVHQGHLSIQSQFLILSS